MHETVTLQVGSFGNLAGLHFWESVLAEHGIDPNGSFCGRSDSQTEKIHSFFHEESSKDAGYYIPRAVVVDLEMAVVDQVRARIGSCLRPDNIIADYGGGGNCWAKGFYNEDNKIHEVMDSIRAEAERCDRLQNFQMVHGIGKGTGAGLGSLLLQTLHDEFPDTPITTFSLFPSPSGTPDCVVEPYNAVLSLQYMVEYAQACVCLDNGVLSRRFQDVPTPPNSSNNNHNNNNNQNNGKYKREGMSSLVADCMVEATASMRFPAPICTDIRKLITNMVPFPRMHFFVPGLSLPLHSNNVYPYSFYSLSSLTQQMFNHKNLLATCSPQFSRFLTLTSMFRGTSLSAYDVESHMSSLCNENSTQFVPWVPNNFKCALSITPPSLSSSSPMSGMYLGNTSAITDVFRINLHKFKTMFSRKCFLVPYSWAGMEEMEFTEAECNLEDLVSEYTMTALYE